MKVLIVDDHALVRDGISSLLEAKGHQVVGQAADGREGVCLARSLRPDIVLMDVNMPLMGGLEATRVISAEIPEAKVVILTVSDDDQDLFDAIKSGARGYILKELKSSEFFEMLEAVERGEAVIQGRLAARILAEFRDLSSVTREAEDEMTLTAREREVLSYLASGYTGKEIAKELFLSESAIKFHKRKILDKLQVHSRAEVVAWAARHGITRST